MPEAESMYVSYTYLRGKQVGKRKEKEKKSWHIEQKSTNQSKPTNSCKTLIFTGTGLFGISTQKFTTSFMYQIWLILDKGSFARTDCVSKYTKNNKKSVAFPMSQRTLIRFSRITMMRQLLARYRSRQRSRRVACYRSLAIW